MASNDTTCPARVSRPRISLLLVISIAVFGLLHLVPGGPLAVYLSNPDVRPEDLERLRRALGLDQPVWRQYLQWLTGFVAGDWGYSYSDGRPVLERVVERLPATLELVGVSVLLAVARHGASRIGRRARVESRVAGVGDGDLVCRDLITGLLVRSRASTGVRPRPRVAALVRADDARRRRASGSPDTPGAARSRCSPRCMPRPGRATCARRSPTPAGSRSSRPRARAARHARVVLWQHIVRPALLPVMTVVLLDVALLAGGTVVTESVFAWPGLGSLFTEALARRDYTLLMALVMLASTAVVLLNLIADLGYSIVDPRVRL